MGYPHKERGFFRFFVLLHLVAFGATTLFVAGSLDVMIVGWELPGISSALLVGFFDTRVEPVRGSMLVFSVYGVADIGLLTGICGCAPPARRTRFDDFHAVGGGAVVVIAGALLLIRASDKSAQLPFSGWLVRWRGPHCRQPFSTARCRSTPALF